MAKCVKFNDKLIVMKTNKIDFSDPFVWKVTKHSDGYGKIAITHIKFPKEFVGKKFRIILEEIKNEV